MLRDSQPYLDLTAIAEVGAAQLDLRPAFVFAADGARVLWANSAGAAFFGARRIGDLRARRFSDLNPIKTQMARLAKLLPSAQARMEMLRFGQGAESGAIAAVCRRLNLPDETRAVLAIAASSAAAESLTSRAEKLVDLLGGECLAAVLTGEGKLLTASGELDSRMPAEPAIDRLIEQALSASKPFSRATVGRNRHAGIARFTADGRTHFLLVVGPEEIVAADPPQEAAPADVGIALDETPIEAMFPDLTDETDAIEAEVGELDEPEPTPLPARTVRFIWETDDTGRFAFASAELSEIVGESNGSVAGRSWRDISALLSLEPDGRIATALANGQGFAATVYWPDQDCDDLVAIDLTGQPFRASGAAAVIAALASSGQTTGGPIFAATSRDCLWPLPASRHSPKRRRRSPGPKRQLRPPATISTTRRARASRKAPASRHAAAETSPASAPTSFVLERNKRSDCPAPSAKRSGASRKHLARKAARRIPGARPK